MNTFYDYRKKYVRICLILIFILIIDLCTCSVIAHYQVNKVKNNIHEIEETLGIEEENYE